MGLIDQVLKHDCHYPAMRYKQLYMICSAKREFPVPEPSPPSTIVLILALSLGLGIAVSALSSLRSLRLRRPSLKRPPVARPQARTSSPPKASRTATPKAPAAKRKGGGGGFWSVANQLKWVRSAGFSAKPVLNKSEYQVFLHIEKMVAQRYPGCRLFAQISLGEILGSDDQQAFKAINSKRVDMLIMSKDGQPAVAIEYQGTGHYQGDAEIRDAIKREALERARIPLVEIFPKDNSEAIQSKVAKAMRRR